METGQRMVQRQQHGGRTVVVQPVATVKFAFQVSPIFLFLFTVLFLCFPTQAALAQGTVPIVTVLSPPPQECPAGTQSAVAALGIVRCHSGPNGTGELLQVLNASEITAPDPETAVSIGYTAEGEACGPLGIGCWLTSAVSSLVMALSAFALVVSGTLFNFLIDRVIVDFGGTIGAIGMSETIGMIWAFSRDIANIVIIGVFVFVAFTVILGIQTYGNRKYVAQILIVAIFINFSLFLTQFIIDISNFVSYQIYYSEAFQNTLNQTAATASITTPGAEGGSAISGATVEGIAGAFMDRIGISGVWAFEDLQEVGVGNGPLAILGFALLASILMGVVAAILFYGVFLIGTRALLLVFLMATAALAVGTAVLPGDLRKSAWTLWRKSLINVAIFAPLIMVFLYAVLLILSVGVGGDEGLSGYLQDPTALSNSSMWRIVFTYIIAVGLLFVSFKLAGDFAKKIGGFDYAATLPALATSLTLGAGGVLGRQTFGRIGEARKRMWEKRAQQEYNETKARTGVGTISDATMRAIKRNDWLSKQSFDARQLKPVQGVFKQSALSKVAAPLLPKDAQKRLVEGGKNGYAQNKESLQKKAQGLMEEKQKLAQKGALNAEKEKVMEQYKAEEITAAERLTTAESEFRNRPSEEAVQNAKADAERLQAELTSIKATESASQQAYAEQLGDIRDQLNAARIRGDATEITRLESERARINSENIASGQRVEAAEKAATTAAGSFKALDDAAKKATNAFETAQKAMETASANAKLKESDIEIDKKRIGELNTDVAKNLSEAARQDIGYDIFSRPRLVVQNWHGIKDSDLPKKVSEKMKSEAEKKKIKEAITSDEEKKEEGGEQKPDEKKG